LIGSAASAVDVSRDIAKVAKEVHVASRSYEYDTLGMQSGYDNMWLHPMVIDVSSVFHHDILVKLDPSNSLFNALMKRN